EFLHWRWAFLGVAVLTVAAFALVVVRLRNVSLAADAGDGQAEDAPAVQPEPRRGGIGLRMLLAGVVATCAVAVGFAADAPAGTGAVVAGVAIPVVGLALLPLLPRGTLRAAPGLPSVVLMRGIAAGAFFAAEAYVPRLLIDRFEFSPTIAGLALTLSALGWSGASAVQGRYGDRLGSARIVCIAVVLLMVGMGSVLFVSIITADPWVVV